MVLLVGYLQEKNVGFFCDWLMPFPASSRRVARCTLGVKKCSRPLWRWSTVPNAFSSTTTPSSSKMASGVFQNHTRRVRSPNSKHSAWH